MPTLKLMISCDLNTKLIHFHDDFRQKWSANPHFHVRTKVNNHTSIVFLLKTLKFHENLHFFQIFQKKVEFERKYIATETFGCRNLIDLMDFYDFEGSFCWDLPLTTPPPDYFLYLPLISAFWGSYSGLIFILSLFFPYEKSLIRIDDCRHQTGHHHDNEAAS